MLTRFANSIPVLFYILFFLTPLVFFTQTSEIFEFNKIVLVYVLTVIISAAWVVKMALKKKIIFRRTILDIPLLLFIASQTIASLFSIDPRTSLLGYFSRFNGGLLSTCSYSLLYWAYVSNMGRQVSKKSLVSLIASSYIVSAYAFLQKMGVDKDLWDQDVQTRVFSTFGQPNWLASFISAIIPLTWGFALLPKLKGINSGLLTKLKSYWIWFFLSFFFFLTLLFTKSRSGILGFAVAFIIFWGGLFLIKKGKKKLIKTFVLITFLFLAAVLFAGTPWTPSIGEIRSEKTKVKKENTLNPEGTESAEIRKIVWEGALQIWKNYPAFGSGVETFAFSYPSFRPPEHNLTSEWEFTYNKAHNEYLNFLATTGIFGLASYLTLILAAVYLFIKHIIKKQLLSLALFSGFSSLLVTNFFGFSVVATSISFFLYPAIAVCLSDSEIKTQKLQLKKLTVSQKIGSLTVIILAGYLLFQLAQYWYSDFLYAKGRGENEKGQYAKAINSLERAVLLSPQEPLYFDEIAHAYAESSVYIYETDRTFGVEELIDASIKHSNRALDLSPRNLNLKKSRARLYLNLALIKPEYMFQAREALISAAYYAPTDAKVLYDLALTVARTGDIQEAVKILEKTISLKPDYRDARFTLALLLVERNELDKAKLHLMQILENNPDDTFAKNQLEELGF